MTLGQKILIWLMFVWLGVPFVVMQDHYPLFRYGMFAEPVQEAIQTEQFFVRYSNPKAGNPLPQLFDPAQIGMPGPTYRLLLRNYYYRRQSQQLLENLHQPLHRVGVRADWWELYRVMNFRDTSLVAQWQNAGL